MSQAMAKRAQARSDLCKQVVAVHLKAQRLKEELQRTKAEAEEQVHRVKDEAAKEKKRLEAELEVEKTKVRDADELLKTICEGKTRVFIEVVNLNLEYSC